MVISERCVHLYQSAVGRPFLAVNYKLEQLQNKYSALTFAAAYYSVQQLLITLVWVNLAGHRYSLATRLARLNYFKAYNRSRLSFFSTSNQ